MNNPLVKPVALVRCLKRVYPPGSNQLIYMVLALSSVVILITLVACQPQIIEVEKPVTRVVEIPVEIIVTQVVEKVVTRLVEQTSLSEDSLVPTETRSPINNRIVSNQRCYSRVSLCLRWSSVGPTRHRWRSGIDLDSN